MAREPKTSRRQVDLPEVPSLLDEQACFGDTFEDILARRSALFAYFGEGDPGEPGGWERVALKLAAVVFNAFGAPAPMTKGRGRPRASAPKYEVAFLRDMAQRYNADVANEDQDNARLFKSFLDRHADIDERLKVKGARASLARFEKLLTVGNSAINEYVIWRAGKYKILHPVVAGVYEALKNIIALESLGLVERLLLLDPRKEEDRITVNSIASRAQDLTDAQLNDPMVRMAIKAAYGFDPGAGMFRQDPLWLMKRNGTF